MTSADSPCTGVCRLGKSGLCEGCLRTLEEISDWPAMSEEERQALLLMLKARSEADGSS